MIDPTRTPLAWPYEALLEPYAGVGLLVLPDPGQDVALGSERLHQTAWALSLRILDAAGYELTESEDGELCFDGMTSDGRAMVGLFGRDPICSASDLDLMIEATAALHALASGALPA